MEKYLQIFETLTEAQKIAFLEKVLRNSGELQSQLVNYFTNDQQDKKAKSLNFNEVVVNESSYYKSALEAIDLEEPDYDRYHNRHDRYYEEWEMAQEAVEDEINEVFDTFRDDFVDLISKGDLETMMAKITSLLIGCYEAVIDDPCDNLGDPQEFFAECFSRVAKSVENEIVKTAFNSQSIVGTIKNVIQCFISGEANKFSPKVHDSLVHCLLNNNSDCCIKVYHEFKALKESEVLFPNSYVLATRYGNPSGWISEAEKISTASLGVAKELLEYLAENDKTAFHRNAKILFPEFSRDLVELISKSMDDLTEKQFAKEVLSFKVLHYFQIADYKRLSGLFSEGEKHFFLNKLANSLHYEFYIRALEFEGKFEEILKFAEDPDRHIWEYPVIMQPIVHKFPSECLAIASKIALVYLEKNMSRTDYQNVAQLLKAAAMDEKNVSAINKLILELCTVFSRRTAMKDEFRIAGILK